MPRIRLAAALLVALGLFAGCGDKPHPQTSNRKAEGAKPAPPAPPDHESVLGGVRGIVAKQLSLDAGAIDVDAPLSKQKVAADELDVVEIVMGVEEAFGVEIEDAEISNPEGHLQGDLSVRKLANIVARKQGGRQRPRD